MSFFTSLHSPHHAGSTANYNTPDEKPAGTRVRGFSNIDTEGEGEGDMSEIGDLEECVLDSDDGGGASPDLNVSYTAHRESIASAFDEDEFDDCIIDDNIHDNYFGGLQADGEEGERGAGSAAEHDSPGGHLSYADSPGGHLSYAENDERETSTHTQILDAHELQMLMVADSVCRLYDVGGSVDMDRILDECYSADACFSDPLISTRGLHLGREGVRAQFAILRFMVAESKIVLHGAKYDSVRNVLHLVTDVTYRPRFCYFSLYWNATITCVMDGEFRVRDHSDQWSVTDLIRCLPILGTLHWLYVLWVGLVTSIITIALCPASWTKFEAHSRTVARLMFEEYSGRVETHGEALVEKLPPRVREKAMQAATRAAELLTSKASVLKAALKAARNRRAAAPESLASVDQ